MVMMAPIKKAMVRMMGRFRVLATSLPMPRPMGVMEVSAPSWNNPIPMISISAPTKNMAMVPRSMGTSSTLMPSTIRVMGRTAESDSWSFFNQFGI